MSAILFKKQGGSVVSERVNPTDVTNLLDSGYFSTYEQADADENESGKLSNDEVRQAAKDAGIDDWETARIATLIKKLK